jgi:hypothetical protein
MSNEFDQYFSGLLTALRAAELEQKKQYYSAIDIEDMAEATAVTIDARTKIQQLRKWIGDLQCISEEVATALHTEHPTAQEPTAEDTGSTQQPAKAVVLIDEGYGFTAGSPQKFVLLGKTYSINGWQELLTKLCEAMVLRKPYRFAKLSVTPALGVSERRILSLDEQQITAPRTKLSNGLYVTIAGSPTEIKTRCEHILSACGYSNDVLQIL